MADTKEIMIDCVNCFFGNDRDTRKMLRQKVTDDLVCSKIGRCHRRVIFF